MEGRLSYFLNKAKLLIVVPLIVFLGTNTSHSSNPYAKTNKIAYRYLTDDNRDLSNNTDKNSLVTNAITLFANTNVFIDDNIKESKSIEHQFKEVNSSIFHLFSHGKPGELFINNQWLHVQEIAVWLKANGKLQDKKQLNIYGCEFAKGQKGQAAVAYLEKELKITVAASTNITGKDGDWVLETVNQDYAKSFSKYQYNLQLTGDNDDFDGDGINNIDDIDDDNDGILDSKEQNCTTPSVAKTGITVTTELNTLQGPISNLVNSVSGSNEFYYANAQNIANKEIVKFLFPSTEVLENISFDTRSVNFLLNGAAIEIQGSNNNTTWSTLASFSVSAAANPSYSFSNFMSFTYYRIYGVSGNTTSSPWVDEAHFIRVVSCTDINTDGDMLANRFDTDSDDDGCGDAFEAGTSNNTGASFMHPTSNVGSNGMYNPLETTPDSGEYDGTYTYANATDGTNSCGTGCTDPNKYEPNCDFDGDGVLNIDDLDDDNDGVLDSVERPSDCPPEGRKLFNTHWAFGNKAGLQWNLMDLSALPTSFTNPSINSFEGSAAISHPETGEYLFYTDGATAWSAVDNTVIASGLGGNGSSLQSGVIVPVPGGDLAKDYFIFGQSAGFGTPLRVSRIDLSLTGTNRKVGATTTVSSTSAEGIGVYPSDNGNYWLAHLNTSADQMEVFEVTSTGVAATPTSTSPQSEINKFSQIMFSPDGKKLISQGFLYDFDSTTGVLSNPVDLTATIKSYYYAEFSADSRVLFFNNAIPPAGLFAYDLSEDIPEGTQTQRYNALEASRQLVLTNSSSRQLSRGVDGRIYYAIVSQTNVGYIELSYNISDQMTFSTGTISIAPNTGVEGLPSFPTITCKEEFLNVDTDMDGIPNHFDLDSDDDGCSDAFESGATTNTDSNYAFTDLASDSDGLSPTVDPEEDGTVNYTLTYSNATDMVRSCPPITLEDDAASTIEGSLVVINVYANDSNLPTDGTIAATNPPNGTVAITDPNNTPNDPSDDVVTYTPDSGFSGMDTFDYTICDNAMPQNCDTATVTITVLADTDGDGVPNTDDLDDDNDGILDTDEKGCSGSSNTTFSWASMGLSDDDDMPNTYTENYSGLDFTFTQSSVTNGGSFIPRGSNMKFVSYELATIGGVTPSAQLGFNNSDNDYNDRVIVDLDFSRATSYVSFNINDVDTNSNNDLDDGVEIFVDGINIRDIPGITVTLGSAVAEDNKSYMHGYEGVSSSGSSTSNGNIFINLGAKEVSNIQIHYFSTDDAKADPDPQFIVIGPISFCLPTNSDSDDIPDYLDLDSDNDNCPDFIEGAGTFMTSDGETAGGTVSGGTGSTVTTNLCADNTCVNANGVPTITGSPQGTHPAVTDSAINFCLAFPDLSLIKTVSNAIPKVGDTIIYTLTVKNDGLANATGVEITDVLPTGVTYVSHTPSGESYTGNVWDVGNVNIGSSKILQITVKVNGAGTFTNTAEISQSNPSDADSIPNNNN